MGKICQRIVSNRYLHCRTKREVVREKKKINDLAGSHESLNIFAKVELESFSDTLLLLLRIFLQPFPL